MHDEQKPEERKETLSSDDIIRQTNGIDFQAVRERLQQTEEFLHRHRVSQEKLDLEISI
jgi:hypothetical protein